jgi:PHD-finger
MDPLVEDHADAVGSLEITSQPQNHWWTHPRMVQEAVWGGSIRLQFLPAPWHGHTNQTCFVYLSKYESLSGCSVVKQPDSNNDMLARMHRISLALTSVVLLVHASPHSADQIWDPKKAEEAIEAGEDIDGYLNNAVDLNSRMLLMESMHRGGYSVDSAVGEFVSMWRRSKESTSQLHLDEIIKTLSMFETSRKEFHKIAKEIGRSTSSVLVQYYQWKGRDTDGAYSKLKREWKAECDTCDVCDDGGILLVCDLCHKAFHLECLRPPLKEMPKASEWYCSQCMRSPAKLRRIPSISLGSNPYSASKPPAMRALDLPFPAEGTNGNVAAASRNQAPDDSSFQAIAPKAGSADRNNFVDLTST